MCHLNMFYSYRFSQRICMLKHAIVFECCNLDNWNVRQRCFLTACSLNRFLTNIHDHSFHRFRRIRNVHEKELMSITGTRYSCENKFELNSIPGSYSSLHKNSNKNNFSNKIDFIFLFILNNIIIVRSFFRSSHVSECKRIGLTYQYCYNFVSDSTET